MTFLNDCKDVSFTFYIIGLLDKLIFTYYVCDDIYDVMNTLKTPLKNLGFSDREIETYTSLLELGEASYTDLAKATGIKRTSLYLIMNKLQERGVVQYKVDTRTLSPLAPDDLFSKLQGEVLKLHKLIPQLVDLKRSQQAFSRLKFYAGSEGIKRAYLEDEQAIVPTQNRLSCVLMATSTWNIFWEKHDPDFSTMYHKQLKNKGYKILALGSGPKQPPFEKEHIPEYNMRMRYLPAKYVSDFDLEIRFSEVIITDLTSKQPYAIKIVSTELAQALMTFFRFAWDLYSEKK